MTVKEFIEWQIGRAEKYDLEDMARRANRNVSDAYIGLELTEAEADDLHEKAGQVLINIGYREAERKQGRASA
jgi:hypothetical protein